VPRKGWRLAYVSLGSNLGDRWRHMAQGMGALAALPKSRLIRRSSVIETAPVGPPQGPYLNAVAELETGLAARELLEGLLVAERSLGRVRDPAARWGPRTIDLDLILYGEEVIDEPGLTTPHPRLLERAFVLRPLAELSPRRVIPGPQVTVRAALVALEGQA
jgi:2-amino-4-hydroxy-6-hydroxymethyldihydropteridine diphosphokinase